jgi:hypothetical protein
MPRAIAGTLLGTALLSMGAQIALCVMIPAARYDDDDPHGHSVPPYDVMASDLSFENMFKEKGWQAARYITVVGEVVLLPLVVLLSFFPQPELFAALAEDGLLPSKFLESSGNGVFTFSCVISGALMVFMSLVVPFKLIWDVLSLGVLTGFNLTNSSLIMLRAERGPNRSRVSRRLMALWVSGIIGAYSLWISFQHCMDGSLCKAAGATLGVSALAVSLYLLWLIHVDLLHVGSDPELVNEAIFLAPGVPFTPGIAILVNFLLMAQFALTSHLALFFLFAIGLLLYAIQQRAIFAAK